MDEEERQALIDQHLAAGDTLFSKSRLREIFDMRPKPGAVGTLLDSRYGQYLAYTIDQAEPLPDYDGLTNLEIAIIEDRALSRASLKVLGVRPRPKAEPFAYRGGRHSQYAVYRVADCIPLPPKREQTALQKATFELTRLRKSLQSYGSEIAAGLDGFFDQPDHVFLDTETTGLGDDDQIVEICIMDGAENVLFHSYVKPTVPVGEGARGVHGISDERLADAPSYKEIHFRVAALLRGKLITAFNSEFDMRMIRQTCEAHGISTDFLPEQSVCAMEWAASYLQDRDYRYRISLSDACWEMGVDKFQAHSATGDTLAMIKLLKAIDQKYKALLKKVEDKRLEVEALRAAKPPK